MTDILDEARQDYIAGNYTAAEIKYRKVLQAEPNNLRALQGLAFCLVKNWKNDEALALCERALQLDPNESAFYHLRGIIYVRKKQYEMSEQQLRRAIELDPTRKESYVILSNVLTLQKRLAESEQMLRQALELDPNMWEAQMNLTLCYARQKHLARAIEWAERTYRAHPSLSTRLAIFDVFTIRFTEPLFMFQLFCLVISLVFQSRLTIPFILFFELVFGLDTLGKYLRQDGKQARSIVMLVGVALLYLLRQFYGPNIRIP